MPISPLMEQTQIMSRVEAVRRARGAGQSRTIGTDLLNSTLHHLFGGMKMPARERKSRYSHQPAFLFPEMDGAVLENPLEESFKINRSWPIRSVVREKTSH